MYKNISLQRWRLARVFSLAYPLRLPREQNSNIPKITTLRNHSQTIQCSTERTVPTLVSVYPILSQNSRGDLCVDDSTENEGLFLLSSLGIGISSLARLSPNGAALTTSQAAHIRATPAETWRPGIAEQHALQLDKFSAGTASLEIVSMRTCLSRPSTSAPSFPPSSCRSTEWRTRPA
jgi:hypothetical protein